MESRGGSSLLNRAQECTRLEDPKRHHNKGTTEYNYPVEEKKKEKRKKKPSKEQKQLVSLLRFIVKKESTPW